MDGLAVDYPRQAGAALVAPLLLDGREASYVCRESRERSAFEAQSDSCLPLVIVVAPYRPGLFSVALGHAHAPARGKRVRGRLHEELADDLGS
jgi:hypothetical protein